MTKAPLVWALLSDKAGDNAQVEAVIDRLPWAVEVKRLTFKRPFTKGKPPFFASLYHVDRQRSDPLTAPWPDAILTIGRRPSMAAMWVRKQSGNRTAIVLFGRPKRHPDHFALIVASAQFRLAGDNVVNTALPLMRIDSAQLASAHEQWATEFEAMPRPLIAVLVGGATAPYAFGRDEAHALIQCARSYSEPDGSVFVTSSRRTATDAVDVLRDELPANGRLFRWGDPPPNPYLGLLAHADGFIVTGDSMSMITEVASLGRPLAIFPLPPSLWRRRTPISVLKAIDWFKYVLLPKLGLPGYPRDLTEVHRALFARGMAVSAGAAMRDASDGLVDEVATVAQRVIVAIDAAVSRTPG